MSLLLRKCLAGLNLAVFPATILSLLFFTHLLPLTSAIIALSVHLPIAYWLSRRPTWPPLLQRRQNHHSRTRTATATQH
jgi:hypothetical protein